MRRYRVGKIVAVEVANAQTRIGIIDSRQLAESTPTRLGSFEKLEGIARDLGEMIRDGSLITTVGTLITGATRECADAVEGIGIGISGAVDKLYRTHFTHQSGGSHSGVPVDVQVDFRRFLETLGGEFKNIKSVDGVKSVLLDNRSN